MTYYILTSILIAILAIVALMLIIRHQLIEIKYHLTGIETKKIISIGNEPRILSRSDEDEFNIQESRKGIKKD